MIVAIYMVLQRKDSACWVIFARTTMAWTLWWWKILAFRMSSPSLLLLQVMSTWCLPKSKAFSSGKAQQVWLGWNSKRNPFPDFCQYMCYRCLISAFLTGWIPDAKHSRYYWQLMSRFYLCSFKYFTLLLSLRRCLNSTCMTLWKWMDGKMVKVCSLNGESV